jgi:F-type H+-transporting ATPase subunit gamma
LRLKISDIYFEMFRTILFNCNQPSLFVANKLDSQRGFATLKDISIRLKSIKNIQKITKSMKMVSAAKYAKAERELKGARIYGEGAQVFFENLMNDMTSKTKDEPPVVGNKRILVMITSDRGLCGSVHTSIGKLTRNIMTTKPEGVEYKLVCVGDKAKVQMQRLYAKDFLFTANEIGRTPPTFQDASITGYA